jgi:hypothetical protein
LAIKIQVSPLDFTPSGAKNPNPAGFLRSLARCGFHRIFTAAERLQEAAARLAVSICIAKTRAPPAFCAKWLHQTAQNPVTRLWMACTRLKINQIKMRTFH